MSYYPALKQRLTCREVAPRYGLKVNASGMALCPFHDEHSPSLKLSRGFHCFGCGAQGDVITFVSRLFGIPPGEAAQKQWEIREINDIMNHTIEGWEPGTTKRISGYGIQRTWHRKAGVGVEQLELPEGW